MYKLDEHVACAVAGITGARLPRLSVRYVSLSWDKPLSSWTPF